MSGPEWTPEHSDAPVEGRPLRVEVGADGSHHHPPPPQLGPNPFGAERAKGFDPKQVERDDADAEANLLADEEATAQPGKLSALVGAIRSIVVALWNRLRKPVPPVVDYDQTAPSTEPSADSDSDLDEDLEPKPAMGWAPSTWTWETRVGVAAVFSFLILVGVFVAQRVSGDAGKTPILDLPKQVNKGETGNAHKPKPTEDPKDLAQTESKKGNDSPKATPPAPDPAQVAQAPSESDPKLPPGSPPISPLATTPSDPSPMIDPTTPPDPGGLSVVSMPEGNPTQASMGDPSKPPNLPGQTSDTLPLPGTDGPAGGPPPTPTTTAEAKPEPDPKAEPEPKVALSSDPPAMVVEAQPPATGVPSAPSPEPAAVVPPPIEPAVVDSAPPPRPKAAGEAAAPQPAKPPSGLEAVPASVAAAGASAATAAMGPGWVVIPSAGKRPSGSPSGDPSTADTSAGLESSTTVRAGDAPPVRDDPASTENQGGPVLHTVGPDENFWTISKDYYNSPRYYKALHKANAGQVPDIKTLYVGTVIRIPPPEALDRSLVDPPTIGAAKDGPAVSRVSTPKTADAGDELAPTRTARPGLRRARNVPTEEPRRPSYKVKANDTLRSIARDTLSDSKRSSEIFNLNRDLLDDPKSPLAPGTTLTLPEDAVIGRRAR